MDRMTKMCSKYYTNRKLDRLYPAGFPWLRSKWKMNKRATVYTKWPHRRTDVDCIWHAISNLSGRASHLWRIYRLNMRKSRGCPKRRIHYRQTLELYAPGWANERFVIVKYRWKYYDQLTTYFATQIHTFMNGSFNCSPPNKSRSLQSER